MQNKDSFDPDTAGIFAGILRALDARHHFAARRPVWAGGLVVATIAVLAAVLFYSYPREAARQGDDVAPIIRAAAGDYKTVPADPGGMDIPHRQSVVFDALKGAEERRVENLLPEAEEPLARAELFAGFKTEPVVEAVEDAAAVPFDAPAAEPVVVAETPAEPTQAQAEAAAKIEPTAGLAAANSRYVQIASVKDEAAARTEWKKLQAAHEVLAPLDLRVQRADLGERGVFFRLQAGPVSEEEARRICKAVDGKRAGGCLVVRP